MWVSMRHGSLPTLTLSALRSGVERWWIAAMEMAKS